MDTKEIKELKKVELHCHLDGSLNINLAQKWSKREMDELKKLMVKSKKEKSLKEYLEKFDYPLSLLQTKMHLKEAVVLLAQEMLEENVIYAEIRFAPLSHTKKGLTPEEAIEAVLSGLTSSGLNGKVILCMKRESNFEENKQVIDLAKKYLKKGVCAVDLAGDEAAYPTKDFKELFVYANEKCVPFTIHAGEADTYKSIDAAISFGASRIGHGVMAIKSFKTMEALKKCSIPLEICPTSNMDTHIYDSIEDHPISRLIDSGVEVTINTDNRTLSNVNLTSEYKLLNKTFGFTKSDFDKMNRTAIKYAFITEKEKEKLLKLLGEN